MKRQKRRNWIIAILLLSGLWVSTGSGADTEGPKTIVDLQPFRETSSIEMKNEQGAGGTATLINLNPQVNAWYLLQITGDKGSSEVYHLENSRPHIQRLLLEETNPNGLTLAEGQERYGCDLWGTMVHSALKQAQASRAAYAPLCAGRLYLRNPVKGHRTRIEAVTDFLRDEVPAGEKIVGFVRDTVFRYLYQRKAEEKVEFHPQEEPSPQVREGTPAPALLDPKQARGALKPAHLGIEVEGSGKSGMALGTWYPVQDNPDITVSLIAPNAIASEIMKSYRNVVSTLDRVEGAELVYLVAFDLDRFDLRYALGTDHPRVGWSDHILDRMKDPSLPGPDGIGTISPLVSTGLISPRDEGSVVAAFTGGFKRTHGAFLSGELALKNHGSHYGFIENGVIFSKLQPGLATLYVLDQGWVDMKTWTDQDNRLLSRVKYARQNGVPIITGMDQDNRLSVPGPLVARWGEGNWSGSSEKKLRSLRAGAALQQSEGKRFLIYAFFWNATPSAMARVFQAYRCRYAMLLDMNALEHTYLAIYKRQGATSYVQHLIQGMSEVDMSVKGQYVPRFLGYSDDRDFFYLTRKEAP